MAQGHHTGDLGDALAAMARASSKGRRPSGIRRTRSLNPAKVGVNDALRLKPGTVATEADVGVDTRTPGSPPKPHEQLTLFDQAELGLLDPVHEDFTVDRTEVMSPPPSTNPSRARALEARYDPDRKLLTVRFRNGGTYAYLGVPTATWRALKRNKSFGKTLDRLVINQYPFEKVSF